MLIVTVLAQQVSSLLVTVGVHRARELSQKLECLCLKNTAWNLQQLLQ